MQQRRTKTVPIALACLALLTLALAFLYVKEMPAPQTTVEKPLEAPRFISE